MSSLSIAHDDAPRSPNTSGAMELRTRAEAEAYVASICFKHAPPRLVGLELEWLLHSPDSPERPIGPDLLAAALGPHAPTTLDPCSPARPLPACSAVSVEPGGQVELSTIALPGLPQVVDAALADAITLHRMLATDGLIPRNRATEPDRPPIRLLRLRRYSAMEAHFDRFGPAGRSAMCSTAAVQVSLDAGADQRDVADRWSTLHALGPVLVAAFANSPTLHGRRTGWKSTRTACWLAADPSRTAPPPDPDEPEPAAAWARRVLDSELLCVRRAHNWAAPPDTTFADWIKGALQPLPTTADLDYHISTLFPPVRPRGHLEVRYIDAQPGRGWALPTAVLAALTSTPAVVDRVRDLCLPARGRWVLAARQGLADPLLARAATAVFSLACEIVPTLGAPAWLTSNLVAMTEEQVARGLCPADDPIAGRSVR